MNIKIEKGVPPPAPTMARQNYSKIMEQIRGMKEGDSFLFPSRKGVALRVVARRSGLPITGRLENEKMTRFWRVMDKKGKK